MNNLIQDSIKMAEKATQQSLEKPDSFNIWFWISIGEFAIIIFLFLLFIFKDKKSAKQDFKKEALNQDIDFDNIINSSFNSTILYDELKVKCHPDRFSTKPDLNLIANNIFQEIAKNKTNIKRLNELKIEAQEKLNINF